MGETTLHVVAGNGHLILTFSGLLVESRGAIGKKKIKLEESKLFHGDFDEGWSPTRFGIFT